MLNPRKKKVISGFSLIMIFLSATSLDYASQATARTANLFIIRGVPKIKSISLEDASFKERASEMYSSAFYETQVRVLVKQMQETVEFPKDIDMDDIDVMSRVFVSFAEGRRTSPTFTWWTSPFGRREISIMQPSRKIASFKKCFELELLSGKKAEKRMLSVCRDDDNALWEPVSI